MPIEAVEVDSKSTVEQARYGAVSRGRERVAGVLCFELYAQQIAARIRVKQRDRPQALAPKQKLVMRMCYQTGASQGPFYGQRRDTAH